MRPTPLPILQPEEEGDTSFDTLHMRVGRVEAQCAAAFAGLQRGGGGAGQAPGGGGLPPAHAAALHEDLASLKADLRGWARSGGAQPASPKERHTASLLLGRLETLEGSLRELVQHQVHHATLLEQFSGRLTPQSILDTAGACRWGWGRAAGGTLTWGHTGALRCPLLPSAAVCCRATSAFM